MLAAGGVITWVSGLVLMLSSFMGWYSGSGDGIVISVIGWHTGPLGKLVFVIGLAVVVIAGLRELSGSSSRPRSPRRSSSSPSARSRRSSS